MYRNTLGIALALCGALLIGGCNNAKSPATTAKDVNAAEQKAEEKSAKAEERAGEKLASAEHDEQHVASVQEENVAKTDAEGQRSIALAKCESLSGDRQQACKDQANAAYDMAVAQAKRERASTDPKR